ncbi:hypothetical protein BJY16_007383 [Actinoplanes octamycinicus]|uniref:Uncharacterized protein n=1 Tax=Actinoplanes octamycinicus TaxID=135948 RepID=A0A7W7H504_9ACTN|nr:hypothetical protein [Actinoplanes octamycinicus]GIE58550.1 hypothetical protein Aoc01nite_39520 [Actinoplanes octamycinicus]
MPCWSYLQLFHCSRHPGTDATGVVYDYKFVINPGKGFSKAQAIKNALNVPGYTKSVEVNP